MLFDRRADTYTFGMNRDITPFGLRIPAELKERIEKSAEKNLRSMNAEMLVRLEVSFAAEEKRLSEFTFGELVDELRRRDEPGRLTIQFEGSGN